MPTTWMRHAGKMFRSARYAEASLVALMTALAASPVSAQVNESANQDAAAVSAEPAGVLAEDSDATDGQEIVVTGTRLPLTSGATLPTPTTVLDADLTRSLGITNVGDALLQLPSFLNSNGDQGLIPENIGARIADLRGLGPQRTLVLVDGRRFVPSTQQGTVNLSLVPSAIVSRSEVVTGGASAAYGSDAVAGVVNLIVDHRLQGLRAQLQRGRAQRGDNDTVQASLAGGTRFADGRGAIVAAAEYERNEGQGDYYSRSWSATEACQVQNFDPTNGLPFNLLRNDCHTGALTAGGLITSASDATGAPVASGLLDTQFNTAGERVSFTPGNFRGFFMEGGDGAGENAFFLGPLILPEYERFSLYGHTELEVSAAFRPFIDLSYGEVTGENIGAQGRFSDFTGGALQIRVDNPFLPQETRDLMLAEGIETIGVGKAFNDLGNARGRNRVSTLRGVVGAQGDIFGDWHWDAYLQHGETRYHQTLGNNIIRPRLRNAIDAVTLNGVPTCRINADADPTNDDPACVAYNPLGRGNFSAAAANYVNGTSLQRNKIEQDVIAANIAGELLALPYGPLSVAAGVEHRRDSLRGVTDAISRQGVFYTFNGQDVNGRIKVTEGYVEANADLLRDLPFAHLLSINGAVRRTHYSTSGSVTTWKVGGVYEPTSFLRLRATRSRDIRAPNVVELFGPQTNGQQVINNYFIDPNAPPQQLVPDLSGGNPALRPEVAETTTLGVILTPISGGRDTLVLSADYYDIKVDGVIATKGATFIVRDCVLNGSTEDCDRITLAPDGTTVLGVNDSIFNLNSLNTRGVDFELSYRHRFGNGGSVSFKGVATYVDRLVTVSPASSIDLAGQTGFFDKAGVPRWSATSYLSWASGGGTAVTVQNRFIGAGRYNNTQIGPDEEGYDEALASPGGFFTTSDDNKVGARLYTNLSVSQTIEAQGGTSFEIYGVVNNLFDKDPPIAPGPSSATNATLFDVIGRSFVLGVRIRT